MKKLHALFLGLFVGLSFFAGFTRADILVVQDTLTPSVLRFTPGGSPSTFATSANLDGPIGIAVDASNNVYVVDQGETSGAGHSNSVAKYSPTGSPLGFFVTPSTPPGNTLNAPLDIAFDLNKNAYVTSETAPNPPYGYIAQYTSAGAFTQSFGTANTNVPAGIAFNSFNQLLYVDNDATTGSPGPNLNSILIYNPANLAAAPTIITPTGAGSLDGAQQIAVDPADGNLFIASTGATTGIAKIQEYNPSGTYIRTLASVTDGESYGVAIDPNTDIVYASFLNSGTNGTIEKYSATTGADLGLFASGLQNPAYLADISSVPEPTTALLFALPALSLMLRRRARL